MNTFISADAVESIFEFLKLSVNVGEIVKLASDTYRIYDRYRI